MVGSRRGGPLDGARFFKGITQGLDGRRKKSAFQVVQDGKTIGVGGWDCNQQRQTIFCSATIREDIQKLAGTTLMRPLVIKGLDKERTEDSAASKYDNERATTTRSSLPHNRNSLIVSLKMHLVALLCSLLFQAQGSKLSYSSDA